MPAERLQGQVVSIQQYDVVGQDSTTKAEFVEHVALAAEHRNEVRRDPDLSLVHMGPPLQRGPTGSPIQTVGTANLTTAEVRQIGVFVDELSGEYEAEELRGRRQYVVHPHVREPDEDVPCRRFSCAGFVLEAYRDAGISLLDTDNVPSVDIDMLSQAYPSYASLLRNDRFRSEKLGLTEEERVGGGWPVVLAGYVITSLNRRLEELRVEAYRAVSGDEYFPSRSE